MKAKIDLDKFVLSLMERYYEKIHIDPTTTKCWLDSVLEDQGLEYKDGEIVEIEQESEDAKILELANIKRLLEKQGEKPQVDGFDAELNVLLKKYEHLSKKELQEPLEFYLEVVRDDLDVVRENPNYHVGWINIYKHEYGYTLSREMCNTCEEARKYLNKNTVATIKIEWEEQQ